MRDYFFWAVDPFRAIDTHMRILEITENLASTLAQGAAKLAPKIAPLTVSDKLRSI